MSSWIVDGSANRFHKTYLKGFLDISGGNVYIRNGNFYINQGDISCNGNFLVQNDISCNGSISFQDNLNSISATEFNYLDGATSNIQTQINDLSDSRAGLTFDNSFSGVNLFHGDVSFTSNVTFHNTPTLASYSVPAVDTAFATKKYVDDNDFDTSVDLSLNAGLAVSGDVSFTSIPHLITPLEPTTDYQLATKKYVDENGLDTNSDLSLNARLDVGGDASFNGSVYIYRTVQF